MKRKARGPGCMSAAASTSRKTFYAMIFAGEHMAIIAKAGWTRDDVKNYCAEHTQVSLAELKRINIRDGSVTPEDETTMMSLVHEPNDFLVVMAGGLAGVQSAFIPGWGGRNGSQAVTREIRRP